jgi:hypothetical protein
MTEVCGQKYVVLCVTQGEINAATSQVCNVNGEKAGEMTVAMRESNNMEQ